MDLSSRLRSIENRLYTLETVSRLRSAAISEGTTEFVGDAQLVIEDGGSFTISPGGSIAGPSWSIGTNEDGTTYAHIGDALVRVHDSPPVDRYITSDFLEVSLDDPISRVEIALPAGVEYAVVVGSVTLMSSDDINAILRARSHDVDESMVVLAGHTQMIPLMMKFEDTIDFEIHSTECFSATASFEVISNWRRVDGS